LTDTFSHTRAVFIKSQKEGEQEPLPLAVNRESDIKDLMYDHVSNEDTTVNDPIQQLSLPVGKE
jgi:hypothetical protein